MNVSQATAWDGDMGDQWVKHIAMYEAMSVQFLRHLLRASAVQASDRVLDVGCGCGSTTLEVARAATDGTVLGVDLSTQQLVLASYGAAAEICAVSRTGRPSPRTAGRKRISDSISRIRLL